MTSLLKQYPGIIPPVIGSNGSLFGQATAGLTPYVYLGRTVITRPNNATPMAQGDSWGDGPIHLANVNRYAGGTVQLFVRGFWKTTNQNSVTGLNIYYWDEDPGFVRLDNAPVLNSMNTGADMDNYVGGGTALSMNATQFNVGSPAALRFRFPLNNSLQSLYNGRVKGRDLWLFLVTAGAVTPAPLESLTLDFYTRYTS